MCVCVFAALAHNASAYRPRQKQALISKRTRRLVIVHISLSLFSPSLLIGTSDKGVCWIAALPAPVSLLFKRALF